MKKQAKTITSSSTYLPNGSLGLLVEKAKLHNHLNNLLQKKLPSKLNKLTLCLVEKDSVVLISSNSSLALRAEKQKKIILEIINKIEGMSQIKSVSIKVDRKKY